MHYKLLYISSLSQIIVQHKFGFQFALRLLSQTYPVCPLSPSSMSRRHSAVQVRGAERINRTPHMCLRCPLQLCQWHTDTQSNGTGLYREGAHCTPRRFFSWDSTEKTDNSQRAKCERSRSIVFLTMDFFLSVKSNFFFFYFCASGIHWTITCFVLGLKNA